MTLEIGVLFLMLWQAPAFVGKFEDFLPSGRFQTAYVEWTLTSIGGVNDGLVERFRTQIAGDSILQSNFGDEDGLHEYNFRSPPANRGELTPEQLRAYSWPREKDAGTRNTLRHGGEIWDLPSVEFPVAGWFGEAGDARLRFPVDFSSLSLAPTWYTRASNHLHMSQAAYEGFEHAKFSTNRRNGLRTVTASFGERRITWSFDDTRGGHAIQAVLEMPGSIQYSETELRQVEGHWIPVQVSFYREGLTEPYKILTVEKATFDQPWHKQDLGPADLGAVFGTQFTGARGSFLFWDGGGLIPGDDFWELVHGYGISFDERVLEGRARGVGMTVDDYRKALLGGPSGAQKREYYRQRHLATHREEPPWLTMVKTKEKDPWDVHVEEFIERHKLPEPAVERAKKTLERAKKLRDAFKYKIRFAEREGRKDDLKRYKEREERIFKDVLVRDLERLAKDHVEKQASEKPGNN